MVFWAIIMRLVMNPSLLSTRSFRCEQDLLDSLISVPGRVGSALLAIVLLGLDN